MIFPLGLLALVLHEHESLLIQKVVDEIDPKATLDGSPVYLVQVKSPLIVVEEVLAVWRCADLQGITEKCGEIEV